ncbi:hypothetical protein [uncultured Hyphomicrobium sp.]|nr:hypothetical protein [uncultured Hyphomicrobium sp.]
MNDRTKYSGWPPPKETPSEDKPKKRPKAETPSVPDEPDAQE